MAALFALRVSVLYAVVAIICWSCRPSPTERLEGALDHHQRLPHPMDHHPHGDTMRAFLSLSLTSQWSHRHGHYASRHGLGLILVSPRDASYIYFGPLGRPKYSIK